MDKKMIKKRANLIEQIKTLETNLRLALQKKSTSQREIDLPGTQVKIAKLKSELAKLS